MVISNITANNKSIATLNNAPLQTITIDNQEYNFANESPEVISTVSTDIAIEDAVPEPLISLNVKGNSEQTIYEGYNLVNFNDVPSKVQAGVEFTNNGDGTFTVNGTASTGQGYVYPNWTTYPAGTYTLTGCPAGGSNSTYFIHIANRDYSIYYEDIGNGTTFTLTEDTEVRIILTVQHGATVNNLLFKPQLTLGTEKKPFEPYVGGTSSPSPDYPKFPAYTVFL